MKESTCPPGRHGLEVKTCHTTDWEGALTNYVKLQELEEKSITTFLHRKKAQKVILVENRYTSYISTYVIYMLTEERQEGYQRRIINKSQWDSRWFLFLPCCLSVIYFHNEHEWSLWWSHSLHMVAKAKSTQLILKT